jgi:hypothetical protein
VDGERLLKSRSLKVSYLADSAVARAPRLSTMCLKRKGFEIIFENLAKIYVTDNKIVSLSSVARVMKKKGVKKLT